MTTRIKISGITTPEDARLAARLGADLVAFVYWPRSARYVTLDQTWAMRRALPSQVATVGIFVDAPLPLVQHVVHHCALDHAQLFGIEPRGEVEALAPHAFKALRVDRPEAVEQGLRAYLGLRPSRHAAPALLLNLSGGLAQSWTAAEAACAKAPVLLASPALDASNAAEAIAQAKPWGVDVWSAVEAEPGKLDPDRLAAFVDAVRRADGR